ncbi:hypothetical protein BaRGS_00037154 [Batillaria attramentaria]|uniref:Uncharacterized protein n=1 Tax=Batillaria attramentaria TaxID=370345 RepID=A0ABD0J656_9CAEN
MRPTQIANLATMVSTNSNGGGHDLDRDRPCNNVTLCCEDLCKEDAELGEIMPMIHCTNADRYCKNCEDDVPITNVNGGYNPGDSPDKTFQNRMAVSGKKVCCSPVKASKV